MVAAQTLPKLASLVGRVLLVVIPAIWVVSIVLAQANPSPFPIPSLPPYFSFILSKKGILLGGIATTLLWSGTSFFILDRY